jgi:hypothetical protein
VESAGGVKNTLSFSGLKRKYYQAKNGFTVKELILVEIEGSSLKAGILQLTDEGALVKVVETPYENRIMSVSYSHMKKL